MPDWLAQYLEPEQLAIAATGLFAFIATIWSGVTGVRKGKPTSPAVAAAIEAASCRSGDLLPVLARLEAEQRRIAEEIEDLGESHRRQRDILIRIEDRTKRS